VLRRIISSIVLASLAAAPAVARTRFVCRYTGIEITDCAEQQIPAAPELQNEGCCDRHLTPAASAMLTAAHEEMQPPVVAALPALVLVDDCSPKGTNPVVEIRPSSGPPVFLITRALLI
jgi:hypothetical protein